MPKGEKAMRQECERLLPVMRQGGFNPSVDHQTPPGVSLENCRIYLCLLREYAEKKLGSRFDPVEFHKVILTAGPCMYKDLKVKVDEYIEENR